jgi:CP family cyanate transporter-like MFS transporter
LGQGECGITSLRVLLTRTSRSAVVALFLAGLVLRPQIVGIGPLLPRIESSLGVSHAVAGLLATIPVLCMGVFAPAAPSVLRVVGSHRAVVLSLAVIGVIGLVRAFVPGPALVLALTVPLGVGIAIGGTVLPVVVREELPTRPALGTGSYTSGINIGAAIASLTAVPLALIEGWRTALVVYAVAAGVVAVVWTRRRDMPERSVVERAPLPFGRPIAWMLAATFALQSSLFYGFNAWLPEVYVDRGWSQTAAGGLIAVANVTALVFGLATAVTADRFGSRRLYVGGAAAAATVAGACFAGSVPSAWLWAVLLGSALGILFTIVMTLPLDAADNRSEVAAMTAVMLGLGYVVSAFAPAVLGFVRDRTGSFTLSLVLLTVDAAMLLALSPFLRIHTRSRPT